jgi:hypothetical protein
MPDLFPTWDTPDLVEGTQQEAIAYGRSLSFDFEKGEFNLDGAGRVKKTDGHTAWAHWCFKTLVTQRAAYLIYSDDYGTDLDDIRQQQTRGARESEIKRVFTEALMADPRTESVRDFSFQRQGDATMVSMTIYPTMGTPVRLEVSVNG